MSNSSLRSPASGLCAVALQSMAIFTLVFIVAAGVSAQAPFFDEAFANAGKPATSAGAWVITATVSLNGHASGKDYISARGPVTLRSDGMLGGDLPMSINRSAVGDNTISIYIRPSNPAVVVVNHLIAGRPYLGRRAVTVSLPVNPNFNYLAGPIKLEGDREIRVDLESQFVKNASPPSGAKETADQIVAKTPGLIAVNTVLKRNKLYYSPDKNYYLVFQMDGNLVVYGMAGTASKAVWSSGTQGNPGSRAVFQKDGNLVVYNSVQNAIWDSWGDMKRKNEKKWYEYLDFAVGIDSQSTIPYPKTFWLSMQNDGNLVVYGGSHPPEGYSFWHSR